MDDDGYSLKCSDRKTRWDVKVSRCVPCDVKPVAGQETSTNCGYDDDGGRHETSLRPCRSNTFNDGSSVTCQPCRVCPPGSDPLGPCNATSDTQCRIFRDQETAGTFPTINTYTITIWAVLLTVLGLVLVVVCLVWVKRKRDMRVGMRYFGRKRLSLIETGYEAGRSQEDTVDSAIISAPVQAILNDLDILEDLIILLDPETQGVKNTKHLASHCGFSSTWIAYAYSMRDSKSPLKAVLEGVSSRQPDWTVEDMVKTLKLMKRNDAIAVLARLRPDAVDKYRI